VNEILLKIDSFERLSEEIIEGFHQSIKFELTFPGVNIIFKT
jgi:hypothetical protein